MDKFMDVARTAAITAAVVFVLALGAFLVGIYGGLLADVAGTIISRMTFHR